VFALDPAARRIGSASYSRRRGHVASIATATRADEKLGARVSLDGFGYVLPDGLAAAALPDLLAARLPGALGRRSSAGSHSGDCRDYRRVRRSRRLVMKVLTSWSRYS